MLHVILLKNHTLEKTGITFLSRNINLTQTTGEKILCIFNASVCSST